MTDSPKYDAALAAATLLLRKLNARAQMPWHEQLAIATYAILDAFGQVQPAALPCQACGRPAVGEAFEAADGFGRQTDAGFNAGGRYS